MDNHTNILLYSKFSTASRKFVEMLDKLPNFNLVCIDNKKTRERILKSDKLNVKEVPCVLRVYQETGYVESFEGDRAFQFLRTYMDQYNLQQTPISPPLQTQQTHLQESSQFVSQLLPESKPRQDTIQKQQQSINAMSSMSSMSSMTPMNPMTPMTSITSIDDLDADINKGQTMNNYMHVPKSVEFDIDIENRQRSVKPDRSVKSSEGGNIVNRAMQMQKEREKESSIQPVNRMPVS